VYNVTKILAWMQSRLGYKQMPTHIKKPQTSIHSEVQLFADGACSGNPGPGGWAFILKHPGSGKVLEK
jgi:hypothetical protein